MKSTITTLLLMLAASTAGANASGTLTLDRAAAAVSAGSTVVRQGILDARASAAEASTGLDLAPLEISGEYLFGPTADDNRWNVSVSQSFDWPGVYAARRRMIGSQTDAAELSTLSSGVDVYASARAALIEYINYSKRIELLESLLENTDSLLSAAEQAQRKGDLTILELNKFRIQEALLRSQIVSERDARETVVTEITSIAGGNDCSEILSNLAIDYPPVKIEPLDSCLTALSTSAHAASFAARTRADEDALSVARRMRLPGLSVGYSHAFEEDTHFNGVSVGLSVPLFSSSRKIEAARANILADELRRQSAMQQLETRLRRDHSRATALKEIVDRMGPVFDTTNETAILTRAYKAGSMTTIDYLNELNYYLEARLNYLDFLRSLHLAINDAHKYSMLR